jgi:sporulation protein YqfD
MKPSVKTALMIEGLNLKSVLKALAEKGYTLFDIQEHNKKRLSFSVQYMDYPKVVAYLKEKCYTVEKINHHGFACVFDRLKKHWLVAAVLAVFICVLAFFSTLCFDVVIEADSTVYEKVCQAVSDAGVKKGIRLSQIHIDEVENALCVCVPEVKYAFVKISGSRVYVSVLLREITDEPIDYSKPVDIVAQKSGKITKILVLAGTPAVKVGEDVIKGQVLIKGLITYKDGTTEPTTALGEVWATASETGSALFTPVVNKLVPTGSVTKRHCLKIGKYTSPFNRKADYDYFETQETHAWLFPLGIKVIYQTVYEMRIESFSVTLNDVLPELQAKAYIDAVNKANFDFIKKTEYGTAEKNGNIFVTATIYADIKISKNGG